MITALLYTLIALHVLVLISTPILIGRERKPLSVTGAVVQILISAGFIAMGVIILMTR